MTATDAHPIDSPLSDVELASFPCSCGTAKEADVFRALVGHIERGEVRPMVAAVFPLQDLLAAQEIFLAPGACGKAAGGAAGVTAGDPDGGSPLKAGNDAKLLNYINSRHSRA